MEPTFDKDGYPTEDTLMAIKLWERVPDKFGRDGGWAELLEFVKAAWNPDYGRFLVDERPDETEMVFITGGWSGNESLIDALTTNEQGFWLECWQASIRGGKFVFAIPVKQEGT